MTVETRARLLATFAAVGLGAVWPWLLAILLALVVAVALPPVLRWVDER